MKKLYVRQLILINELSTIPLIDYNEPFCKRAKLDTGTQCNYKCKFCYYRDLLTKETPFEIIKDRIDYLIECGIKEVDLSGGESSIHNNWFDILIYCKYHGLNISTLTNGSMFSDINFLRTSKDYGLQEILFSLHGYDEDSHNKIVGDPNGFKNIIQSIKNANELKMLVRINCVVSQDNYRELPNKYSKLIEELRPYEVNFLTLNLWNNAKQIKILSYKNSTDSIKACIDKLDFVPIINVRYTPYCYMSGYEKYVCNIYQHIYDIYDWNMAVYDGKLSPSKYKFDPLQCMFDVARNNRVNSYYKSKKCMLCKYFYICDGLERDIDLTIVNPIKGDMIREVNYFRKDFYENKYIDIDT